MRRSDSISCNEQESVSNRGLAWGPQIRLLPNRAGRSIWLVSLCSLILACFPASRSWAERPRCYELLPSRTLAYLRIADVQELGKKFDETSLGKIIELQQMESLTSQLFEEAEQAFAPTADAIGLTIRDLLAIPTGELTIAAVAPPDGNHVTAPVLMVDVEGQQVNARKLIDLLERGLADEGRTKVTENYLGTELHVFEDEDTRWTGVVHFQKESMYVLTTNRIVAEQILAAWDGDEKQKTLEDNQDFAEVMRHSKGPRDAVPQIRWFIDPVSLAKVSFRGNTAAQGGLAFLPVLGLDGLLALGGSYTMATDEYDTFAQAHIITAEPRTGVLAALAMKSGDPTPELWVPQDVATYQTMYWDLEQTETEVARLFNSFRGAGVFEEEALGRASEFLGVDVLEDVIKATDGRLSMATWIPRPATSTGVILGGIKLKEGHDFDTTLAAVMEKVGGSLEEKTFGGFTYYHLPEPEEPAEEQPLLPFRQQPQQFSVGVVGDYLLLANRASAIERAITTRSSRKSLAQELEFKLVASKLRSQPGGRTPGRFVFQRPEEGLRMLYEMATAESTRGMLASGAENNEMLRTLNDALNDNPLPPFAKIRQYLAPSGSIMTADKKGFHYIGFGLRRATK